MEYATPTTNWVQYNVHTTNPPPQSTYSSYVPRNHEIPNSTATYLYNPSVTGGAHDYAPSIEPGLNPDASRVDSAVSLIPHTIGYPGSEPQSVIHYNHLQLRDTQSLPVAYGYYWDANSQNWTTTQTARQYQANPVGYNFMLSGPSTQVVSVSANGSERLGFATPGSTGWANHTVLPYGKGLRFKGQNKKPTKIVESAICEVCKINCNSKDILVQHKLGKKHKKKMEKLRQLLGPPVDATVSSNPTSQLAEQPNTGQTANARKKKKKASGTEKDLENKRRKVIEGGAAADSVRTCTVCNVVCNSDTVFNSHLAGQMHATHVQKLASQNK